MKNNKPTYQKITIWGSYILMGFLGLGVFLDSIGNAISILTVKISSNSTIIIVIAYLILQFYLRKNPLKWIVSGTSVRIKKIGIKGTLFALGMILLLWLPHIFNISTKDNNAIGESQVCTPFHKKGCYLDIPYSGYTSSVNVSPNSGIIGMESKAIFFYNKHGAEINVVTFSRTSGSKEKYKPKSFPLNSSPYKMNVENDKLLFEGALHNIENRHLGNFSGESYNVKEFEGNCAYTVCEDNNGIEIVTNDNEVIFSVSTKDEYCEFMGYYQLDDTYYVYYKPNEYMVTKDPKEAKKFARYISRKFDHSSYKGTKCKRIKVD